MTKTTIDRFKAARRVSTPIIQVITPDPAATIATLAPVVDDKGGPCLQWDRIRGLQALNAAAAKLADPDLTHPVEMLERVGRGVADRGLPTFGVVFMIHAHLSLTDASGRPDPQQVQAIWNLRDAFKVNHRTLVLLTPAAALPAELLHDVFVLDEPLPNAEQLAAIVRTQHEAAKLPEPSTDVVERAVDRLTGLAAYSAEQVTAMSLTKDGLDLDALMDEQARVINGTPGLSVYRPTPGDAASLMRGCDHALGLVDRLFSGHHAPRGICWIDEIEKAFGGLMGDTSGTTQDQLGVVLQEMQDMRADGVMLVGHPGTGKSMFSKAVAARHQRPLVRMDLGAAKDSLVGSSEARIRNVFKTLRAVTEGRVLFLATSNGLGLIPPELRRRFKLATFMFDLPVAADVAGLVDNYAAFYQLTPAQVDGRPSFDDWTGAEVATACELASRLNCTLADAAGYVVPVATSMPERIANLRAEASGRYLDARVPGIYGRGTSPAVVPATDRLRRAYGRD